MLKINDLKRYEQKMTRKKSCFRKAEPKKKEDFCIITQKKRKKTF